MPLLQCYGSVRKSITITLILIAVINISCKKEKIKGCTTNTAVNYNSSAEEDDGTCKYEGSAMFWMDGSVTTNGTVDVVLNNIEKNITVNITSGTPSCGESGCANFANLPTGTYNWVAEDQVPIVYQASGTITINANVCSKLKLN